MNCPQCNQPVGNDQFHLGDWIEDYDAQGNPIGCTRSVAIACGFCGVFEVEQDHNQRIIATHGPFHSDKHIRRLERRIPAARFDRRIPA